MWQAAFFVCLCEKRCDVIKAIKSLLKRPVSYHAVLAQALQSVPAAVMLSQGLYWQEIVERDEKTGGWFYVTGEGWFEQTGVTKQAQLTARKRMSECGFWEEELRGMPAKTHYRIDIEALVAVINGYLETRQPVAVDYRNKKRQYTRTSSGKFRQQVAVKNGSIIETNKETNKETLKRVGAKAPQSKPSTSKPKKEKAPPQAPAATSPVEKTPTLTYQMREVFERHYQQLFNDDLFDWQQKEWKGLKELGGKLRARLEKKGGLPDDQSLLNSFDQFLTLAAKADQWTVTNGFTPSRLNGQYQAIIQKIIAKNTATDEKRKFAFGPDSIKRAQRTAQRIADDIAAGKPI